MVVLEIVVAVVEKQSLFLPLIMKVVKELEKHLGLGLVVVQISES